MNEKGPPQLRGHTGKSGLANKMVGGGKNGSLGNKAEARLWGRRGERQRRQGQRIPIYIKPIPCLKPDVLQASPHILISCWPRAAGPELICVAGLTLTPGTNSLDGCGPLGLY